MPSKVKIYTRTGDRGKTSLYGGKRVFKNHLRVNAYGLTDELNSLLGLVVVKLPDKRIENFINQIQNDLLLIGSFLAGADVSLEVLHGRISEMEKVIDCLDKELPKLRNFILPGGTETGALLHFIRAVGRRTEREIVKLSKQVEIDEKILVYFNRLSDFLFILARYLNFKAGMRETIWEGRKYWKRM